MAALANLRRAKARPVKTDKHCYEGSELPAGDGPHARSNASDAPLSGLAHLEAPESLDEAVRLAKAKGIIEQIRDPREIVAVMPGGTIITRADNDYITACLRSPHPETVLHPLG